MEQEKRIRREIANSNERRRMQSINAGFQSLRTLLPHHEGEKLSKAAILQQTAEYIYQLEQEKTSLLSQNCQLKRLVNQHEGQHESSSKKRKLDTNTVVVPLTAVPVTVSESSDEGIGSMSPEPVSIISTSSLHVDSDHSREMIELRVQLDRERKLRMHLEDQVRSLESQLYPERIREITQQVQMQYHHQEVIEHTPTRRSEPQPTSGIVPMSLVQETAAAVAHLQVVSGAAIPPVGQTTVVTSSPVHIRSRSPSPSILLGLPGPDSPVREAATPTPPPPPISPSPIAEQRLPSILEAAIKAEPKVEVERLPSPSSASDDVTPQSRLYAASTSRQNLETIVEAIRHLEGDQFINDGPSPHSTHLPVMSEPTQEAPLALTTHKNAEPHRLLKVEMNPFLQFHSTSQPSVVTALQQQRPGVIVVKQHT
ncbi:transcription factor AP-4 isoform X2 [Anabrus simplex]